MKNKRPALKTYLVKFYRKPDPEKRKKGNHQDEYMGSIQVDDYGVNQHHTIEAKAFRQAPAKFLSADKLRIERL